MRRLLGPRGGGGGLLGLSTLQGKHAASRLLVRLERVLVVVVFAVGEHVLLVLGPLRTVRGQGQLC